MWAQLQHWTEGHLLAAHWFLCVVAWKDSIAASAVSPTNQQCCCTNRSFIFFFFPLMDYDFLLLRRTRPHSLTLGRSGLGCSVCVGSRLIYSHQTSAAMLPSNNLRLRSVASNWWPDFFPFLFAPHPPPPSPPTPCYSWQSFSIWIAIRAGLWWQISLAQWKLV